MNRIILLGVSLFALAACAAGTDSEGGGGTGGGSSTSSGGTGGGGIGSDDQPFTLNGQAVAAQFVSATGVGAFSGPQAATVNGSADTNGDGPDRIVLTTGGDTITLTDDTEEDPGLNGRVLQEEDGDGTILVSTDISDAPGLEYTAFAGWTQSPGFDADPTPGQPVYFGVIGQPAATLPGGSATYRGNSVGLVSNGTQTAITTSDVTVETDFSSVTVTSSGTLAQIAEDGFGTETASDLDFTATGTVTGTGYAASGGAMQVDGTFYGPNAEETGGVFRGTPGGANYGGAFGAAR